MHKYGIHSIDKILMLPSSPQLDSIIKDIIAKMQEFKDVRWPQVDFLFLLKRCLLYQNLNVYRSMKLFFKSGKKIPQA